MWEVFFVVVEERDAIDGNIIANSHKYVVLDASYVYKDVYEDDAMLFRQDIQFQLCRRVQ